MKENSVNFLNPFRSAFEKSFPNVDFKKVQKAIEENPRLLFRGGLTFVSEDFQKKLKANREITGLQMPRLGGAYPQIEPQRDALSMTQELIESHTNRKNSINMAEIFANRNNTIVIK